MILHDFVLHSRVNQRWDYSGLDSLELCSKQKNFLEYPHKINYVYNSRGFRDREWPKSLDELKNSIWCVGDSFTVGLGSPLEHTWPYVLQQVTGTRTINVSMDGASNNWIARKSVDIFKQIQPIYLVIQWSYISRREKDLDQAIEESWQNFYQGVKDSSWPDCTWKDRTKLPQWIVNEIWKMHGGWTAYSINDESRRLQSINCDDQEDVENTLKCIDLVNQSQGQTRVIHSFIPDFAPEHLKGTVESYMTVPFVPEITKLDRARDGHHYDIKTSEAFVQKLMEFLNL